MSSGTSKIVESIMSVAQEKADGISKLSLKLR